MLSTAWDDDRYRTGDRRRYIWLGLITAPATLPGATVALWAVLKATGG
jgi:hypothetical protein